MSFFEELKRRNVIRVGIAYAVGAWLLLQLADVLSELLDLPPEIGPVVVTVVLIGFPVVLLAAWAFELTPDGIMRESEVSRDASITRQTGRKLDRVIIVVLALAVGYLLVDKLVLQDRAAPAPTELADEAREAREGGTSVAVLPFVNMSNDPDNEYFSDGLTDTLLHMLAQMPELRVAARTSSFAFKGENRPVSEIAAALGVANILEGSVQRAGNQVRITAQLIRADDGFHVWSQNYTRPLEDIFAIQDEIATDVAGALGSSLGVGTPAVMVGVVTEDLEAFDLYLQGLDAQAEGSFSSLELAEDRFQQALLEDPGFTDARVALVRNYLTKRLTGLLTNETLQTLARPLIEQVLAEDPENRVVPLYLMLLDHRFTGQFKSREAVRKAILETVDMLALAPTETFIRYELAMGLSATLEEPELALELLEEGFLIDPLEPLLYVGKANIMLNMERPDEAEIPARRALELAPERVNHYNLMRRVARAQSRLPEALDWLRQAMELDPKDHEYASIMTRALYDLDLPEEAEPWYARVQTLAPGSAVARSLEILRAEERDDQDQVIELAWQAMIDGIDDRGNAHTLAAAAFSRAMMRKGAAREGFERIGAQWPDAQDWGERAPDGQAWDRRLNSMVLLTEFGSQEDVENAWRQLTAMMDETGWPWREPGNFGVTFDALIRGDIDAAVANELELFRLHPAGRSPAVHERRHERIYQPLYDVPSFAAAWSDREREVAEVREAVVSMLATEDWAP